jgi:hypothetical protein
MNVTQSRGRGTGLLFLKSDASRLGTPEHRFNRAVALEVEMPTLLSSFSGTGAAFILGENLEQSAS